MCVLVSRQESCGIRLPHAHHESCAAAVINQHCRPLHRNKLPVGCLPARTCLTQLSMAPAAGSSMPEHVESTSQEQPTQFGAELCSIFPDYLSRCLALHTCTVVHPQQLHCLQVGLLASRIPAPSCCQLQLCCLVLCLSCCSSHTCNNLCMLLQMWQEALQAPIQRT